MKQIFILCNSEACLREISWGRFPMLDTEDIFTCNNAFTFFRTTGKHFNFFTDAEDINRFVRMPEKLFLDYHKKVKHIFSDWDIKRKMKNKIITPHMAFSPVSVGASSAINALFFLNSFPEYERIWLVGYTINEWEGMNKFPNLKEKKAAFDAVAKNYSWEEVRPAVYKYTRLHPVS